MATKNLSEKPELSTTTSTCTSSAINEDLVHNMSYLSLYDSHKTIKPNKARSKNGSVQTNDTQGKKDKIIILEEKFNRSELKGIANIGNDYTQYVNLDLVYKIGGEILYIAPYQLERLDQNKRIAIPYSYNIKMKDVKYILWDFIVKRSKIEVNIENLDYEKFD